MLAGEVTHEDSMGNRTVIKAGDVQRMSAGTGITHSEYNLGDNPVHFYQVWILPDERRLKPSYEQKQFSAEDRKNRLLPVVSGLGRPAVSLIATRRSTWLTLTPDKRAISGWDSRGVFVRN